jgi:hypothetical protein
MCRQVMMKLSDQLFKRKVDEAEKEFSFTEFLNLVDSNTGGSPACTLLVVLPFRRVQQVMAFFPIVIRRPHSPDLMWPDLMWQEFLHHTCAPTRRLPESSLSMDFWFGLCIFPPDSAASGSRCAYAPRYERTQGNARHKQEQPTRQSP